MLAHSSYLGNPDKHSALRHLGRLGEDILYTVPGKSAIGILLPAATPLVGTEAHYQPRTGRTKSHSGKEYVFSLDIGYAQEYDGFLGRRHSLTRRSPQMSVSEVEPGERDVSLSTPGFFLAMRKEMERCGQGSRFAYRGWW